MSKILMTLLSVSFIFSLAQTSEARSIRRPDMKAHVHFAGWVGLMDAGEEGSKRVTVSVTPDGKIKIDASAPFESVTAFPVLVKDDRPVDGNAEYQVGHYVFIVGSGFTIDGSIGYSLRLPDTNVIPLNAWVHFNTHGEK
jgi:hypothetical protein